MTGVGLCADRAWPDADLWRAAHHQLRPRRDADGGAVRGVLRVHPSRHRSRIVAMLGHRTAVLRHRLRAAAFRHRPGQRMATTATSCWSRSASPSSSRTGCCTAVRTNTRTIDLPYAFRGPSISALRFWRCRASSPFRRALMVAAAALAADALHRYRQGDPRGRQGEARRAAVRHRCLAHLCRDLRPRHRVRRHRGLPADPDLSTSIRTSATPSCWWRSPSWCWAAWARSPAR